MCFLAFSSLARRLLREVVTKGGAMEFRLLGQSTFSRRHLTRRCELCNNMRRQFNDFAFVALLARVKPGKFYEGPRFGGCVHLGASPFVISSRAFPGPHSKSGGR